MSQKQNCIKHAKEQMANSHLSEFFNMADFNHVYRKLNGAQCNAYLIGLHVSDFIIFNHKNKDGLLTANID